MRSRVTKRAAYFRPASGRPGSGRLWAGREKGCLPPAREKPLPPGG